MACFLRFFLAFVAFGLDVLLRRPAELQQADAELGELDRLIEPFAR